MARGDIIRTAMLKYHAGELTLDQAQAAYRQFTPDASPPPADEPGAAILELHARRSQLSAAGPDDPSTI